jgi:ubiquinone/menaquinone biosynthesis C-methylase UbiE
MTARHQHDQHHGGQHRDDQVRDERAHDQRARDELAGYYRERAGEYDAVYLKPERQADLAALKAMLPPLVARQRVLEIAAGTGYWTEVLSQSAASITATDLSPQTLAIARQRRFSPARVRLLEADAYDLAAVPGDFDLVFAGFWWSHVLRADVPAFLAGLCRRVPPGTRLILLDNRYVPGSSQPVSRTGPGGDTYQLRRLQDGSAYEVVKNFPVRDQLTADLACYAADLSWTQLEYYWLATCALTGAA